jgi:hypothetical protein
MDTRGHVSRKQNVGCAGLSRSAQVAKWLKCNNSQPKKNISIRMSIQRLPDDYLVFDTLLTPILRRQL